MSSINIPLLNKRNYYSERLSGDFLRLYNSSVENLSKGILTTSMKFVSDVDIQAGLEHVTEAILYGCPELFYIKQQIEMTIVGKEITLNFINQYFEDNLIELWNRLTREVDWIAEKVNAIPNPYDKINRINKYLCARVKYSSSMKEQLGDPYGALILKTARCEGYAKAAKIILDRTGFNSIIAFGQALNGNSIENHAWNIIEYKAQYYHFDFTWNAIKTQYSIPCQEYMFLDDLDAHVEHFPKYQYPLCNDATKTFWALNNGIIKYHSDLSRINIVPFNNNYMAIAKMPEKLSDFELRDDIFTWMSDELAGYNYGSQLSYSYNERLNLLTFYFIN